MNRTLLAALVGASLLLAGPVAAASPEQEKAFVDAYKAAYEAGNAEGLKAFLHTEGADPMGLEFYSMMLTGDFGGTITEIELVDLSATDEEIAAEVMPGPDGKNSKLLPKPYKKLMVTIERASGDSKSTSTNQIFIADEGDRLTIATPGAAE